MCKHGSKAHVRLSSACRQPAATHLVVAGGVAGALGVQVPLVAVAAHLAALTAHQALDLGRGKIGSCTQLSTGSGDRVGGQRTGAAWRKMLWSHRLCALAKCRVPRGVTMVLCLFDAA